MTGTLINARPPNQIYPLIIQYGAAATELVFLDHCGSMKGGVSCESGQAATEHLTEHQPHNFATHVFPFESLHPWILHRCLQQKARKAGKIGALRKQVVLQSRHFSRAICPHMGV